MAALISSICCTLIILAFCQILAEAMLPEGGTKRYVVFITGLVGVLAIVAVFTATGGNMMKTVFEKTAQLQNIAESQRSQERNGQTSPYQEYIEKLIGTYR
jgi:heme exporter protein D